MATIAITFVDQPDGRVDVQVYLEGVTPDAPATPAQKLVRAMLQAAQQETADTIGA